MKKKFVPRKPTYSDTLIGYYFPFFLGNGNLGESYYLYQVTTPCLGEDLKPLISIKKIGERTTPRQFAANEKTWNMNDTDIFATLLRGNYKITRRAAEYVNSMLERNHVKVEVYENSVGCPALELDVYNSVPRSLIINLRTEVRWKFYRLVPGRRIDVLCDKDKFAVFNVCGTDDEIWLEPWRVFKTTDPGMKSPIKNYDLTKLKYPKGKFSGKTKVTDLMRGIKKAEWEVLTADVVKEEDKTLESL